MIVCQPHLTTFAPSPTNHCATFPTNSIAVTTNGFIVLSIVDIPLKKRSHESDRILFPVEANADGNNFAVNISIKLVPMVDVPPKSIATRPLTSNVPVPNPVKNLTIFAPTSVAQSSQPATN